MVPDVGLLVAVERYAGAEVHKLRGLCQQYQDQCWLGLESEAEKSKLEIYSYLNRN